MTNKPAPRHIGHLIGGVEQPLEGPSLDVHDPADGRIVARCAVADAAKVDEAVAVADAAFATWRETSLTARAQIMFAYRALLDARRVELATLVSAEHGKTVADALGEVSRGVEVVEYACGIRSLLEGRRTPNVSAGVDVHDQRRPLGVMVGITPFNFPAMVPLWMFPLSIACGNTFVLKPSEKDPGVSVLLAQLAGEAGVPDGVLNVVHGGVDTVEALVDHPRVAGVSFVGSTPVATAVHQSARAGGRRVQALGGAKNHMVVTPDADLSAAADAAVAAGFGSAGERCMAISVIVAVGDVADEMVNAVAARARQLTVGPSAVTREGSSARTGRDRSDGAERASSGRGDAEEPAAVGSTPEVEPDMGPLITHEHLEAVRGWIETGLEEGAELVLDGREIEPPVAHEGGYWLGPCLFDRVTDSMAVYANEIFGPVLSVVRVADLDQAIALINRCPFANGTAIFTSDGAAARRFTEEIEVGMVGVNVAIPVPVAQYSFGGWRDSLFGEHHIYGEEGVRFATRAQVVTSRWPEVPQTAPGRPARDRPAPDLGFPGAD